eukprot:TRINITY_DN6120_c0_g1_i2.p1 TRINITY_DN6120_c0_g1~~TRINITY_DN6120_c0_g1_i2.p1  ORF type:complete len:459 (-),score=59.01 TRINITY_DN6120_c0_g1_i2:273-1502(-)
MAASSVKQLTPRSGTPRQGTPRQSTPRQHTPRQHTPRDGTPRQRSKKSNAESSTSRPRSARPGSSVASARSPGVPDESRGKRVQSYGDNRDRTPVSDRRAASLRSARSSMDFVELDDEEEDEWPVYSKAPRAAPNDLRRRIAGFSRGAQPKPSENNQPGDWLHEVPQSSAGHYGHPEAADHGTAERMLRSYSARSVREERRAAVDAYDHHVVLEPHWAGDVCNNDYVKMQKRQLGPEKENFVHMTKTIRSVPGYTGYIPAKKSEGVYGGSHEKTTRLAKDARLESRSHKVLSGVERLSKACIPGYAGHCPARRDETFAKTHGDSTREAEKVFRERHREHVPARPPKHMASCMPEGAWYGNAPHYLLAGECASTTRIAVRGPRHAPGALAWDKPQPQAVDWHTGVLLRLR